MANQTYVVDPATREPVRLGPVSFRDIGVRERDDLERWIAKDPGLLGERLLVISSEFSGFDKSNRRLDILALDSKGSIVIIELKLDANRSLADQQAIRYAAMCSDMTMDDVVRALAESDGCSTSEAEDKLRPSSLHERKALPFFFGLILGEITVGAMWTIIGIVLGIPTYDFWPGKIGS